MSRRIRAYRSGVGPQKLQADMHALAHRLGQRADDREANSLTVEQLRDLAIERGLADAQIIPSHRRLMATGHGAYFPSEVTCEADITRLLTCRQPSSCPIDGEMVRQRQMAVS